MCKTVMCMRTDIPNFTPRARNAPYEGILASESWREELGSLTHQGAARSLSWSKTDPMMTIWRKCYLQWGLWVNRSMKRAAFTSALIVGDNDWLIGLLYNEAQQDAKVAQTTLTYTLTVHRNEKNTPVPVYQMCLDSDHKQ